MVEAKKIPDAVGLFKVIPATGGGRFIQPLNPDKIPEHARDDIISHANTLAAILEDNPRAEFHGGFSHSPEGDEWDTLVDVLPIR